MANRNNLYGLLKNTNINITYDVQEKRIIEIVGFNTQGNDIIEISEEFAFTIPTHISINGVPYFPSKYEIINSGRIIYSSLHPPIYNIQLLNDNELNQRVKTNQNTITLKNLMLYDRNGRKRNPIQKQIMGESAQFHAQKLIDNGDLVISPNAANEISWHWCHLVAFRMLPTEKAQKKNNLICGTSACNGHMTNIESAVKQFIYEFKRPLGLEVTATTFKNSHVASRIRYRVFDKKGSLLSHDELFDALTDTKSDILDFRTVYERLRNKFQE